MKGVGALLTGGAFPNQEQWLTKAVHLPFMSGKPQGSFKEPAGSLSTEFFGFVSVVPKFPEFRFLRRVKNLNKEHVRRFQFSFMCPVINVLVCMTAL